MEQNKENEERYGVIYKITNTVNGKCYIGHTTRSFNERYYYSGKGIERVYNFHKSLKEHNSHYNTHLLRSIEKYGPEVFDIIEEFDIAYSKEKLNELEKKYIKEFNCIENGYNHEDGGSDGKPSEEVRKKISEAISGENHPMYGKHRTDETRLKISKKVKERMKNPDVRRKISESRKGKYCGENHYMYGKGYKISGENNPNYGNHKLVGKNNPNFGKKWTEEQKRKISESLKGKFAGENHPMARKIICLNDSKIFNTRKECAEYYKLTEATIRNICKGITKKSRSGLIFMYYDEYLQQQEQQDQAAI